ncbi:MAG: DUF255 domain-containing protein [Planctomycetota bacterium]|nr:DUF255 domain-containing protein [Planctomycetota bacterium]
MDWYPWCDEALERAKGDIYMAAVQRMAGSSGWPMSVWLTPGLKPFYGGTYFPPSRKLARTRLRMVSLTAPGLATPGCFSRFAKMRLSR